MNTFFPLEILDIILLHASPEDSIPLMLTCKTFLGVMSEEIFWRNKIYPHIHEAKKPTPYRWPIYCQILLRGITVPITRDGFRTERSITIYKHSPMADIRGEIYGHYNTTDIRIPIYIHFVTLDQVYRVSLEDESFPGDWEETWHQIYAVEVSCDKLSRLVVGPYDVWYHMRISIFRLCCKIRTMIGDQHICHLNVHHKDDLEIISTTKIIIDPIRNGIIIPGDCSVEGAQHRICDNLVYGYALDAKLIPIRK